MSYEPELSLKHWVQDEIDRRKQGDIARIDGRIGFVVRDVDRRFDAASSLFKEHNARFEDIAKRVNAAFRKDAKKLKKLKAKNARVEGELLKALQRIEALEKRAGIEILSAEGRKEKGDLKGE